MSWTKLLLFSVVVMALSCMNAHAQQTCSTTANPLADAVFGSFEVDRCVKLRCQTTTGSEPSDVSNGYCDGNAAAEQNTDCGVLEKAYLAYYGCLYRAMNQEGRAPAAIADSLAAYMRTPGFPYTMTNFGCFACNHFRDTVLPAIGSTCSDWTCQSCCSQDPDTELLGSPGKGYNAVLCGVGCTTSLLMTAFTLLSALMFCICGIFWPSPSFKTTYKTTMEEVARAQRRERGVASSASDNDDVPEEHEHPEGDPAEREPVPPPSPKK